MKIGKCLVKIDIVRNKTFSSVVKAQTDMADKIVNSLKEIRPVKEQQQQEKVLKPSKKSRLSSEDEYSSLADA